MHTVFALLCFVVVIRWLIFPYPSGLLHWHCGNLTIGPVPAKQPWWMWINISCELIMNDCIATTKQSTTKPCAYFLWYTVHVPTDCIPLQPTLRKCWRATVSCDYLKSAISSGRLGAYVIRMTWWIYHKLQCNLNLNLYIFFQENAFLSRPQWVNSSGYRYQV